MYAGHASIRYPVYQVEGNQGRKHIHQTILLLHFRSRRCLVILPECRNKGVKIFATEFSSTDCSLQEQMGTATGSPSPTPGELKTLEIRLSLRHSTF